MLTVANAGHLAPHLGGEELVLENGRPLGVAAGTAYAESRFEVPARAQLTVITDGVIEARDKSGQLFGFERTAMLSIRSAEEIMLAAQAFGHEDDLTVVTLTRVPADLTPELAGRVGIWRD